MYRKIEMKMWVDRKFKNLSPIPPCGQGLWIYLLTGLHTGIIPGLFRASHASMAGDLGWSLEAFDEAFQEAFREGLVKDSPEDHLIWIPNALKYNPPASPNVILSWRSAIELLPECDLLYTAISEMREFIKSLDNKGLAYINAFDKAFGKPSPKPSKKPFGKPLSKTMANQEQEQEQDIKKEIYKENLPDSPQTFDSFCKKIIDLWKEFGIKPVYASRLSVNMADKDRSAFANALSMWGVEKIENALMNYRDIKNSPNHKAFPDNYSLPGFLVSGVEMYETESEPFTRCKLKIAIDGKVEPLADRPDAWTQEKAREVSEQNADAIEHRVETAAAIAKRLSLAPWNMVGGTTLDLGPLPEECNDV